MKIHVITNHKYIDEVQTIAQVFIPHAKFSSEKNVTMTVFSLMPKASAAYTIASTIEGDMVLTRVYKHEAQIGQHNLNIATHPQDLTIKRLVMLAMYHAMQEAIGAFTPWGALTGVRPTKMVREWMANGQSDAEIAETLKSIFCVQEDRARLAIDVAHAENRLANQILTTSNDSHRRGGNLPPAHYNLPHKARRQVAAPTKTAPIGLYISIPFCPSRCVYCSFNTAHKPWNTAMQEKYTQALIKEAKDLPSKLNELNGHVSSIYIGGGTPTALADNFLEQLLNAIQGLAATPIEYTIEAGRPDTITPSNLKIMKKYGVNRISINPQTFNDATLEKIGRKHTTEDFLQAYEAARVEGFTNINTDIIAGLPGEGPRDMHHTMETLAKLSPENITIHTLAIKRASKLNEHRVDQALSDYALPDAAAIEAQLKIAHGGCASQGLIPYYLYRQKNMAALFENTGFARPGKECLYNVGMMSEIQTVLGIGAGAVSKYIQGSLITRSFNTKNPEIYIEKTKEGTNQ
ncbi:MAG: coproporphyrinogen dehydrogenase HemZ [Defluviitaleaceae bacterium]|nr:coproporphyrinogen dehydrogenase HemZ [Defluviitaleaceae bacterium]